MSNEKMVAEANVYFEEPPKSYFSDSLEKYDGFLRKWIELKGDYVESILRITERSLLFKCS